MKHLSLVAAAIALASLASQPAAAQRSATTQTPLLHSVNPSLSATPTTTPLGQQMQQDYVTQLRGAQRELLLQNPSGLGRQEEAVGRALNNLNVPQ